MPYPNTVLSAWQLTVLAVVAVGTLAAWLVAVFLAARPSRGASDAALASPGAMTGSVAAGTERAAVADEPQPARQPGSRKAA
jgi:hypothetical protein